MRVIMLDLDTLRPDHMSCYGYERETTPNLDAIAAEAAALSIIIAAMHLVFRQEPH